MAHQELQRLGGAVIDGKTLSAGIQKLVSIDRARLRRLWAYYRNPMRPWALSLGEIGSERPYRQAQEWGLPSRITGVRAGSAIWNVNSKTGVARKEIVIENDIGWRVDTMVDYLFGKPLNITSTAPDEKRRDTISRLLRLILGKSGGILFLQQLALLGAVYGFVDVVVKLDQGYREQGTGNGASEGAAAWGQSAAGVATVKIGAVPETADAPPSPAPPATPSTPDSTDAADATDDDEGASVSLEETADDARTDVELERIAARIRLEIVEPANALPFLSSCDYRVIEAYAQVGTRAVGRGQSAVGSLKRGMVQRLRESTVGKWVGYAAGLDANRTCTPNGSVTVVDIITPTRWQRYEDETLVAEGENSLGVVPVVHIQNVAMPFEYSGAGDVEPLIPLQDELNTRLSDRAHRISLQSFKMYLGKGIDDFISLPVAPGRMWMTDNEQASVQEFGGDESSPSEESHISDVRDAMDKISGVTPVAAGTIKNKIGRLTSAAALRITLLALLARTDKKRTSYGTGIGRICELALMWLDRAGVFHTSADERRVELHWPSPLPENELESLQGAQAKLRVGVPREIVLRELGYSPEDLSQFTTGEARDASQKSTNRGGSHGGANGQNGNAGSRANGKGGNGGAATGSGGVNDVVGDGELTAADVNDALG